MSKETKVGLLVSLGIILVFAMILSIRLSGEGQTDVTRENEGTHTAQYVAKTSDGDVLDRESEPEPGGAAVSGDGAGGDRSSFDAIGTDQHETGPAPGGADLAALGARDEEHVLLVAGHNVGPAGGDLSHPDADSATRRTLDTALVDPLPPQPTERPYTVARGDSLYIIAEKVFGPGQGSKWPLIAKANPAVNPSKLRPGMKLVIPVIPQRVSPLPPAPEGPGQAPPAGRTYVVAAGDTLGEISTKMYGTCKKWKLIQAANRNVDPGSLKVGMTLAIPQAETGSPAPDGPGPVTPGSGGSLERALEDVRQFVAERSTPAPAPYSTYRVVANDTLIGISRRVLGSDNRWREIYEMNRDRLARPNALVVGQTLRLPATTEMAMADTGDLVR